MITLLKKRLLLFLLTILVLGGFLRFYGLDWDQGHHLHPDERAIVMFTTPLSFPNSIEEFLSPGSLLNPHFFAYGNFPLYLLKATAALLANFDPMYLLYEKINLVGRAISAIADIGTLILIYLLAKKLFSQTAGLLAAFFYAISVFPIQTAHFYAVDTLLTFFITLTLYQLVRFHEKPSILNSILVGLFFGLSLATKTSATPLVIAIVLAIAVDFILLVIKQPHKPHIWSPHLPRFLKRLVFDGVIITIVTIITFATLQPYAIIDFQEFLRQTQQVSQVMYNAFAFPFTLQYVGKNPYLYELKNIFLWGQGPILATLSFLGAIYLTFKVLINIYSSSESRALSRESREVSSRQVRIIIILIFFWIYFLIVGKFAIGFMRYLLPIYPLLALFAAVFTIQIIDPKLKVLIKNRFILNTLYLMLTISLLVWPLAFMHIYTKPNTRVQATNWINQNIPYGATLAIEHWDDGLPLYGAEKYKILTLELYNPDTPYKRQIINQQLSQTDYIIIASNRLYVPLMKLTDCQNLPTGRCYTQTAEYYKKLFSGLLGFKKVAEFALYPKLEIGNWKLEINDSSADESFTVYDHPKVMIFSR